VYAYRWIKGYLHPVGDAMFLIVKADRAAEITGSVVKPAQLSVQDVAPFEAAVIAAGFPTLRGAPPEPLYLDHFPLANTFEAAIDGKRARTTSKDCGEYDASVDKAFRELLELVNAHEGLAPDAPQIEESPIAVEVMTASQLRRHHK
jgi:hypothetical protein